MDQIPAIMNLAVPLALVFFRLAGLFVMSPLLASASVPQRWRLLFAMALAVATLPAVPAAIVPLTLLDIAVAALTEGLIGYVIGCVASLPILAMEMSGAIIGQQAGFGLGRVYNPELDTETDALGQLLTWLGLGTFIAIGGLETLYACIARSFAGIAPGGVFAADAPLDLIVEAITSGTVIAARCAAPVVGLVLLITLVIAILGRTTPQINVMAIGFTVKVLAALSILALAMTAVGNVLEDGFQSAFDAAWSWIESLTPVAVLDV